jgi:predicted transcriptional regulator
MDMQTVLKAKAEPVYRNAKEQASALLARLPDSATFKEIQYELYVLAAIDEGMRAVDAGDVVSHDEAGKLLAKWLHK